MSSSRNLWLFIAILVSILFLALVLGQLGYVEPVRGVSRTVLSPFQSTFTDIATGVAHWLVGTRDIRVLEEQNRALQVQVNRLSVDNARYAEIESENQRLRQLLNFTRNNTWYDYETAAVVGQKIGEDTSNLLFSIFIDVGARDGVAVGMPVVTERGLVGRVVNVGPKVAEVLLIIDPISAVEGRIQTSRATGIVRGSVEGGLVMDRIPQGETISPGDIVFTSGLGGHYPDKLVIGQITEVSQRDLDMFQSARIRPTVDFGKLETVLVITTFEPIDFREQLDTPPGGENVDQ
jgi:rod shape-determining protein MreC